MAPQIIYLVLMTTGMIIAIKDHGKPRKPQNAVASFIATIIVLSLLAWGVFFDCWLK